MQRGPCSHHGVLQFPVYCVYALLDCVSAVGSVPHHPDLPSVKDLLPQLLGTLSADSFQLSPSSGSGSVIDNSLAQGHAHSRLGEGDKGLATSAGL